MDGNILTTILFFGTAVLFVFFLYLEKVNQKNELNEYKQNNSESIQKTKEELEKAFPLMKPDEILSSVNTIIDFYLNERYFNIIKYKETEQLIDDGKYVASGDGNSLILSNSYITTFSQDLSKEIFTTVLSEEMIYQLGKVINPDNIATYIFTRIYVSVEREYLKSTIEK